MLFLYEIATRSHSRLRFIAQRLDISVQAASLLYRKLAKEGQVTLSDGNYRLTVKGIAHLHTSLIHLGRDVQDRLEHLKVIRTARAVAKVPLRKGESVDLSMEGGLLYATRGGRGSSTGRVVRPARAGGLVEVEELQGIVRLAPAKITCVSVPLAQLEDRDTVHAVRRLARSPEYGLVAAHGLEAFHLVRTVTRGPVARFGVPSAVREASQVGVPSLVILTEDKLADLLQRLGDFRPAPAVEIRPLGLK